MDHWVWVRFFQADPGWPSRLNGVAHGDRNINGMMGLEGDENTRNPRKFCDGA